ncbi:hypothetical protein F4818DRAFT_436739 [Hypoxylon cercidicola]|nr:hypothetical protein F4818DRAFT_436739 [Hypoxylon cercidicola]
MFQLPIRQPPSTQVTPRLTRFPQLAWLPEKIRRTIWEYAAANDDGPRFVLQSGLVQIIQKPPALAHACRESRQVALRTGRMFQLGNGRGTWFRPETDVFLWGGSNLGLGELPRYVRNMVITNLLVTDYYQACDTFEWLLNCANFTQLETVYVEMGEIFTLLNNSWHPAIEASLFKTNTIIIPNLFFEEDELSEQIDKIHPLLPDDAATTWRNCRTIAFTQANEWVDHIAGDVTFAWISTQAKRRKEIHEDEIEAVENEVLMHPSGIPWWNYLANNAPTFSPTCVFARLADRELVRVYTN